MGSTGSDCPSGKIQYTPQGAAEKVAKFRKIGDKAVTTYTCWKCGCHHVGHKDGRQRSGPRTRASR